jgi:two-component system chemotaxis response regulator CheB
LKPSGVGSPDHEQTAAELVRTVKLMSEVKVVRRWAARNVHTEAPIPTHRGASAADRGVAVVAVGASTGGPQALQSLLAPLPADFPAPILVVQHIAVGFTAGFAEWLARSSRLPVRVAAHGDVILPGRVYLAPENVHMKVGLSRRILLTEEEPENGLRPAVSVLFRSVAAIYGASAAAVLLSGMGKDGAYELKLLKDLGAVTIAQDRESSVVHGMPGEAIRLGGTTFVLSQEKIGPALARLAGE